MAEERRSQSPGEGASYSYVRGSTGNQKAVDLADKFTSTARLHNALQEAPKLNYTAPKKVYVTSPAVSKSKTMSNEEILKREVDKQWKPYTAMKVDAEFAAKSENAQFVREKRVQAKSTVYALEADSTQILQKKPPAQKLMENGQSTRVFTSDRLQKLHEKKIVQHNEAKEAFRVFRRDLDISLQQRVEETSLLYKKRFEDMLDEMEKAMKSLVDSHIVHMTMEEIDAVWENMESQFLERRQWIESLQGELFDVEDERLETISTRLRELVKRLGEIGKAMPGEIERLLHSEAHSVNVAVIRNRTSYQELSARMKIDEIDKQDDFLKRWRERKVAWRSLRHGLAIQEFHKTMMQEMFTHPPQVNEICDHTMACHDEMRGDVLHIVGEEMLSITPSSLIPSKQMKELCVRLQSIRTASDDASIQCCEELKRLEADIHSKAMDVYAALKKRLLYIGAKNEQEIDQQMEEECKGSVESRHARSLRQVEALDDIMKIEDKLFHLKIKGVGQFAVAFVSSWEKFLKELRYLHEDVKETLDVRADNYADEIAHLEGQLLGLLLKVRNAPTKAHLQEAMQNVQDLLGHSGQIEEAHRKYNSDSVEIVQSHRPRLDELFATHMDNILGFFGLKAGKEMSKAQMLAEEEEKAKAKAAAEEEDAKQKKKKKGRRRTTSIKSKQQTTTEQEDAEAKAKEGEDGKDQTVYEEIELFDRQYIILKPLEQVIAEMIDNVYDEETSEQAQQEPTADANAEQQEQEAAAAAIEAEEKEKENSKKKKDKRPESSKKKGKKKEAIPEVDEEEEEAKRMEEERQRLLKEEEEREKKELICDREGNSLVRSEEFDRSLLMKELPLLRDVFLETMLEMREEERKEVQDLTTERLEALAKEIDITLRKHHPRIAHIESMVFEAREAELKENAQRFQRHVQRLRSIISNHSKHFESNKENFVGSHHKYKATVEQSTKDIPTVDNLGALQSIYKSASATLKKMKSYITRFDQDMREECEAVVNQCEQIQSQFIESCQQCLITEETNCENEVKVLLQYRGNKKKKKSSSSRRRGVSSPSSPSSTIAASSYAPSVAPTNRTRRTELGGTTQVGSNRGGDEDEDDEDGEGESGDRAAMAYRYHEEEIGIYMREIRMLDILPQNQNKKHSSEIDQLVQEFDQEYNQLKEEFEETNMTMHQKLSVDLGLGQKYGAPKRKLTAVVREEFVRSERMGESIQQRLNALEKLLASEPGQKSSVRIPSRASSRNAVSQATMSEKSEDSLETDGERQARLLEEQRLQQLKKEQNSISGQVLTVLDSLRVAIYRRCIYLNCITDNVKSQVQIRALNLDFNPSAFAASATTTKLHQALSSVPVAKSEDVLNEKIEESIVPLMAVVEKARDECRESMTQLTKELKANKGEKVDISEAVPSAVEEYCTNEMNKSEKRRISDIEGLRKQVEILVQHMPDISRVVMEDILLRSESEYTSTHALLLREFEKRLSEWRDLRTQHNHCLKPSNAYDIVEEINRKEQERKQSSEQGIEKYRGESMDILANVSKQYMMRLIHVANLLVEMFDSCIHEKDLAPPEGGRPPNKHKSIKHLIRERNRKLAQANAASSADNESASKSSKKGGKAGASKGGAKSGGKKKGDKKKDEETEAEEDTTARYRNASWTGVKTNVFVAPFGSEKEKEKQQTLSEEEKNAADLVGKGSKRKSSKRKSAKKKNEGTDEVVSSESSNVDDINATSNLVKGFRHPMNRSIISARNESYEQYLKFYNQNMEDIVNHTSILLNEEQKMYRKWSQMIDSIREEI